MSNFITNVKIKNNDKTKTIILLLLSFIGTYGIANSIKIDTVAVSNSVLTIILFVLLFCIYKKVFKIITKRLLKYSLILGLFLSLMLTVGNNIYMTDTSKISQLSTYINVLLLLPVFSVIIALIIYYIPSYKFKISYIKFNNFIYGNYISNKKWFLITWFTIFACWLPAFLATYPGIYGYDSPYQTHDVLINHIVLSHHPILHTYYLSGCFYIGNMIFGNYEAGMAIYSITQMLILSATFAYVLKFLSKVKVPGIIHFLSFLFFAVFPVTVLFSFCATKDVLFAAFFILCIVFFIEAIIDQEKFFNSKWLMLRLVVMLFLMAHFRNNAYYAFLIFIPFCIALFKKHWKKITCLMLSVVIAHLIFTGPIYKLLNIQDGNPREALCVPIQQMSRALRDNKEELSNSQIEFINKVIPNAEHYISRNADNTKNTFRTDIFTINSKNNFKMYLSIGLKCPITYVDAFLCNNFGYWYPDMIFRDPAAFQPYIEYKNHTNECFQNNKYILIKRTSLFPTLSKKLNKLSYENTWQSVPVVSMLFSPGLMFWLLVITLVILMYYKRWKEFTIFLLPFFLWGTTIFGPVVLIRYVYSLFLCIPLYFGVLFGDAFKNEKINRSVI